MMKKWLPIALVIVVLVALFGFISMRRSQMMGGGGMGGSTLELTAVSQDGNAIPVPADVEAVTGKLAAGSAAQQVGDMIVVLSLTPYPGTMREPTDFAVKLLDATGQSIDDASITLDMTMPAMHMPQNQPALGHVSDGQYQGNGQFTMRGWWRIEVIITRGGDTRSAFFDLGL